MSSIEKVLEIYITKAKQRLRLAEEALAMEYYDSAVSNAYMCVEACLRALLLSKGIRRLPKTHGGILRLFIQEFIATGILPRDLARNIGKLLEMRGRADYEAVLADTD